jgi:HPt (histidine-containing phosphotransfer) domain-containing protein
MTTTLHTALLERVGGDPELLGEVIDIFLETCPPLVETIRQALARRDCSAVRRGAHELKGSAANFDATDVAALARRLESHTDDQDVQESLHVMATLDTEVTLLIARLAEIRTSL